MLNIKGGCCKTMNNYRPIIRSLS